MSRFYTAPDQVLDGDVAYARDVNRINNEADAAFTAVAAEIDAQEATLQSYVDKASLWANEVEDVEVEPGKYSALHFAAKSEDFSIASAGSASSSSNSASAASGSATSASNAALAAQAAQGLAESARDGAQLAETNAEATELKASKWSDEAENVEVEPGRYSAFHWSQKAEEYAFSVSPPSDEAYGISWNGSLGAATRNALYDKFELVASAISAKVSTVDIDDTPVSGATTAPISSNWAYIHNAASNPHGTTKADVGLGSVDNTSDLDKPISSATQTALDSKEPSLGAPAMDGYVLSSTTAGVRSWVEVSGGGGLSWSVVTTNTTAEGGNGYLFDNSSAIHTLTLPASPAVGDTVAAGDLGGDFATYPLTIARNGANIMGVAEDLTLDVRNQRVTLVYSGATRGWVIVDELFGAHPKTVLNKPFMHVQDQKPSGTNGGSSIAGWQTRVLNTVLHNDIQGASLASNQVTLPAGTYYVEGLSQSRKASLNRLRIFDATNNTLLLGLNSFNVGGTDYTCSVPAVVSGLFTLSEASSISIGHYIQAAVTTEGLGRALSQGTEVYSDLRIWQLDRSLEIAPVAVNSGLQTIPGLDTTGNIMGFNLRKTGANQVTVSKGSCLDSTLTVPLALTADTAVAIPAVANTIYHIFVVRLVADGSITVKAYTSEAAVASDGTVDKWRWVGWWLTNGGAQCIGGYFAEETLRWDVPVSGPSLTTEFNLVDFSSVLPVTRCTLIQYGTYQSSGGTSVYHSINGVTILNRMYAEGGDYYPNYTGIPWGRPSDYYKRSAAGPIVIHAVKVRR